MLKVDTFCHIFTPRYFDYLRKAHGFYLEKRVKNVPALTDLELRFRIMDTFPDYVQVPSMSSPPLEALGVDSVEAARVGNDELAELVGRYPERFPAAVAVLPLDDIEASIAEAERALGQLGLRGVQIYSHVNGRPLDDPAMDEVYATLARHDLPLFLHPARGETPPDYPSLESSQYEIWHTFGWPYHTTVAMTHLVFSGIFDRYPDLKIISHHMGGMVPFFSERIRGAYDQYGVRSQVDRRQFERLHKRPLDYFRMFYADTSLYGSTPALQCGLSFFGEDRVLFASDMPFDAEGGYRYIRDTIRAIDALPVSTQVKRKICQDNPRRLLKIEP